MSNLFYINQPLSQIFRASFVLLHLPYCTGTYCTNVTKDWDIHRSWKWYEEFKAKASWKGWTMEGFCGYKICLKYLSIYWILNSLESSQWAFLVGICNVHTATLQLPTRGIYRINSNKRRHPSQPSIFIQTKQIHHNKWIIKSDHITLEISHVVIIT
jgi:hypothetical protein